MKLKLKLNKIKLKFYQHLEQEKHESRRLWREVTHGLKLDNIEAATAGKQGLEQVKAEIARCVKLLHDCL